MKKVKMKITGITYNAIGSIQNIPNVTSMAFGSEQASKEGEEVFTREDFFNALEDATRPIKPDGEKEKKG